MNRGHKHVIGHYYPERTGNLDRIVDGLNVADIKPVIWNNSGRTLQLTGSCEIINCPNNPIHGRYLVALIYPEFEVFIFQDDDLVLGKDTIDRLVRAAAEDPEYFHGVEGNSLDRTGPKPYSAGGRDRSSETTETHMVIRAYACHRLTHGIHPGRSETILFTGGKSRLVRDTSWEDLPENGVGLWHQEGHEAEIDEFIKQWKLSV